MRSLRPWKHLRYTLRLINTRCTKPSRGDTVYHLDQEKLCFYFTKSATESLGVSRDNAIMWKKSNEKDSNAVVFAVIVFVVFGGDDGGGC